jgi:spore photoproduct lyase
MKRHLPEGLSVAKNHWEILTMINNHSHFAVVDKPNQTDDTFITYDISCNEDFALHAKYHKWEEIFEFFAGHAHAKASFATKYVNPEFLKFNPDRKVRIRFSLMPQDLSTILEPGTSSIYDRIEAINEFIEAGYDVHINFSPVIVSPGWLRRYEYLFKDIDRIVKTEHKSHVKCEVIFLTHNKAKHEYNIKHDLPGEYLLWKPEIQEDKISQYGGKNLRYRAGFKKECIEKFEGLKNSILPWCTTRYIF